MNKSLKTIGFFLLLSLVSIKLLSVNDSTKILFIGNSITYFNNMPTLFKDMANTKGKKVKVNVYAPGGKGFLNHYIDPNVYSLFRNNEWDIVVLQPGSGESPGVSNPVNTTIQRGQLMLDSIYKYSKCAKVYLYQIPYGVPTPTSYGTYFAVQNVIQDSITKMADALKLQIVPAGACARAYYAKWQNILLHNSYGDIHPNLYGSYLTAASFYSSIFQDSITGCNFYSTLPIDSAKKFQRIADSIVLPNFQAWRINTYNLKAKFTNTVTGNVASFTNLSSNYTSTNWLFGDNSSSSNINPTHSYTTQGTFSVKLISKNVNNCADTAYKLITVNLTAINDLFANKSGICVFPNPCTNEITLSRKDLLNHQYCIIDLLGKEVLSGKTSEIETRINVSKLPSGNYFLKVSGNPTPIKFIKAE